jgi:hypothetical protein
VIDDAERVPAVRALTDEEAEALDEKFRRGEELSAEDRRAWLAYHAGRQPHGPKPQRPWTAQEDALVRSLPVAEAARRTRRTLTAVHGRRAVLGLTGGGKGPRRGRRSGPPLMT